MGPPLDIHALGARLPASPQTRFAPSPTGRLHLGHVVNAVFVWGLAGALGGRVLLRIEDHDRERSRPEYEAGILEDLSWLGLQPDDVAPRQSDREPAYEAALARLASDGRVFACRCSRREIRSAASPGDEPRYPGTCRDLRLTMARGRGTRAVLGDGAERFEDARLGWQAQDPHAQCGDLLARDRSGHWTYQFAVTVDDMDQQIDLVVRGEDLLSSTGRQIRLARLLGRTAPAVYLHHPLLYGSAGAKLSKSTRDAGLDAMRGAGWPAPAILGAAAARAGLLDTPIPLAARDLPRLFGAGDPIVPGTSGLRG